MPIVKYIVIIKRKKPSEVPKAFGAENERKYSISGAHAKLTQQIYWMKS